MPRVVRVGDYDDDDDSAYHPDPGTGNKIIENDATVWVDNGGVGSGTGQTSPVAAASIAVGAAPSSLSGLTDEELIDLQAQIAADQNGTSGRNAGTNYTRNEYGEHFNNGDTGATTSVDETYTLPEGTDSGAGITGDLPPIPTRQNGQAGPDFNNYAPVPDDEYLVFGVYAAVGRQVDPAIVGIARAMAVAVGTRLHVNSGYRDRAYNSSLDGAAQNSNHMYGVAMDLSMGNLPESARRVMLRAAIENGAGGIGIYAEARNNFIHIDLDRRRTWRAVPTWGQDLMRAAGYIS